MTSRVVMAPQLRALRNHERLHETKKAVPFLFRKVFHGSEVLSNRGAIGQPIACSIKKVFFLLFFVEFLAEKVSGKPAKELHGVTIFGELHKICNTF